MRRAAVGKFKDDKRIAAEIEAKAKPEAKDTREAEIAEYRNAAVADLKKAIKMTAADGVKVGYYEGPILRMTCSPVGGGLGTGFNSGEGAASPLRRRLERHRP